MAAKMATYLSHHLLPTARSVPIIRMVLGGEARMVSFAARSSAAISVRQPHCW